MTTEGEIGMMWLQAKDSRQLPEARRGKEQFLPYSLQREHSLAEALILAQWNWFWVPGLQDSETIKFLLF